MLSRREAIETVGKNVDASDPERSKLTPHPEAGKPVTGAAAFDRLAPRGVLLGLDPGRRRLGVAASDSSRRLASPVATVERRRWRDDLQALEAIAGARRARGIVLGLPLNMDGSEGRSVRAARQLARNLIDGLALPVLLWDERLTSFAAGEALAEAGHGAAERRRRLDRAAAALILQDALDALAALRRLSP